jgi:hypothetical protein
MKKADNFDATKWLVENKITSQSRLNENKSIDNIIGNDSFLKKIASSAKSFNRDGDFIKFTNKDGKNIGISYKVPSSEENNDEKYKNIINIINYKKQLSSSELKNFEDKYKETENDFDDDDFDLKKAFAKSPNKASYDDVLYIFQSYEDEDTLNGFKSKFPKGKPINKLDYTNFAMDLIDDMSEVVYVQANWISLFDDDIYEKAGLV